MNASMQGKLSPALYMALKLALLWGFASSAFAATLTPMLTDQRLGVVIGDLKLPDTLHKDLKSGLTNRMLIRVSLSVDAKQADQATAELAVKYDLWDETFGLQVLVNGGVIFKATYARIDDAVTYLSHPRLPQLFVKPPANKNLSLKADLLLNPVDREKMDKLRSWVTGEATVPSSGHDTGSSIAVSSKPNAVFNRIFQQYMSGDDLTSAWRTTVTSKQFALTDLHDETQ